jgi:hypothetical protein
MPRKSAEAISAAWWQARQRYGSGCRPKPPSWLGKDAAQTFRQIVGSRAPDLFGPGSLQLLEHFCFVHHHALKLWSLIDEAEIDSPQSMALQKQALTFVALEASLAVKLALLPRHQHGARSGVLSERTEVVGDPLLGGTANEVPF